MNPTLKSILFGGKGTGSAWGDLGLFILRAGSGAYMSLAHGMHKLFQDGHFGPTKDFIGSTQKMGFPAPTLFAWISAFTEAIVALMFALGLFTRPAALALVINMLVAGFIALHGANWTGEKSREMAMLYLIPFLTILFTGPGHFSADAMIRTAGNQN